MINGLDKENKEFIDVTKKKHWNDKWKRNGK
jgi:hypothetical protein